MIVSTPDMSCGHCVAAIERQVGALSGVLAVKAELPGQSVTVEFDPERIGRSAIEAALDEAGYPVAN